MDEESGVIVLMVIKEGETALPISVNVTVLALEIKTYSKDSVLYFDYYQYFRKHGFRASDKRNHVSL